MVRLPGSTCRTRCAFIPARIFFLMNVPASTDVSLPEADRIATVSLGEDEPMVGRRAAAAAEREETRMHVPRRRPPGFDVRRAFEEHGGALLGYTVNALRDRPLAEDCVQETFLRAWRAREQFDPRQASERTWLFSIARNVIVDAVRARARLPLIGDDAELESRATDAIDPLERLRILEGLAVLSEAHRTAVVAVHLHGRTYQELSDATGVPVATWRTRTFHALRALRTHFEEREGPDAHPR